MKTTKNRLRHLREHLPELDIAEELSQNSAAIRSLKQSIANFDEAFETIAGVDYDSNTIQNQGTAKHLGRSGKRMWEDRENSKSLLEGLIEWTELYKDKYSYINTCGW